MSQGFESAYGGTPPWDTGRPQPEITRLAERGLIQGKVLDAGCGTGENALWLAAKGLKVWGIDAAPTAIRRARAKARQRNLRLELRVHDALGLQDLGVSFDCVLDCGLYHALSDGDRNRYVASLAQVIRPDGKLFLLCFSDREPGTDGPRRVSQAEIHGSFAVGWSIDEIQPAKFESRLSSRGHEAWLASLHRQAGPAGTPSS
jgi:SAM-dependent methyltransferase